MGRMKAEAHAVKTGYKLALKFGGLIARQEDRPMWIGGNEASASKAIKEVGLRNEPVCR